MLKAFSTPTAPPRYESDASKKPPATAIGTGMGLGTPGVIKPPAIPPRPAPPSNVHRESVGVFYLFLLSIAVVISTTCVVYYYQRDRAVYEELVDYLEKTVSISKINYNPALGLYELMPREIEQLGEHRQVIGDG